MLFSAKTSAADLPTVEDYYEPVLVASRKHLKLGAVPGPYRDMFMDAVQPTLARKGYTVEIVLYDNYIEPNLALASGDVDLNIFQHSAYLNNFKFERDLDISAIVRIPTVSMKIFSSKYASLDEIEPGSTVAIPDDNTNKSRALRVLDLAGLISIDPSVDKYRALETDIVKNPRNLRFSLLKAHRMTENITRYDVSVINGNFAYSGGLDLSKALYSEFLEDQYMNVIAVRTEDMNQAFVMDVVDAIHSEYFINAISAAGGKYSEFQRPRNFLSISRQ